MSLFYLLLAPILDRFPPLFLARPTLAYVPRDRRLTSYIITEIEPDSNFLSKLSRGAAPSGDEMQRSPKGKIECNPLQSVGLFFTVVLNTLVDT